MKKEGEMGPAKYLIPHLNLYVCVCVGGWVGGCVGVWVGGGGGGEGGTVVPGKRQPIPFPMASKISEVACEGVSTSMPGHPRTE
jgi:hypothetical protein